MDMYGGVFAYQGYQDYNYRWHRPYKHQWYQFVRPGYQPLPLAGYPPPWECYGVNQTFFNPLNASDTVYQTLIPGHPQPWGDGIPINSGFVGIQGYQAGNLGQLGRENLGF